MTIDKLSDDWLFRRHSKDTIKRWVNGLKYSYYNRAWGGHANDGDSFVLTLIYAGKADMLDILQRLGITLNVIPEGHPKPVPGKAYSYDEWQLYKHRIEDYPEYERPGRVSINGISTHCEIHNGNIRFSFLSQEDPYEVTEAEFIRCKKLEALVEEKNLTGKVSRDAERIVTCISKTRYKELLE